MTALLQLQGVSKSFSRAQGILSRLGSRLAGRPARAGVQALHSTDLELRRGEVVALVGESGCGKSTLGRIVAGLHRSDGGRRLWEGRDISELPLDERRRVGLGIQMVFQDPHASLNPRIPVGEAVGEAAVLHGLTSRANARDRVADLFRQVGLEPAWADRYPHQFSGGQRARVGIARALSVQPRLLVCDESVAALDDSMQAQVLNLFMDLREQRNLTYLFISHDLGVVRHIADRVGIMYLGKIVELAPKAKFFSRQFHPYSQALISAIPVPDPRAKSQRMILTGDVPSPINPPAGCIFSTRCPKATERCKQEEPQLHEVEEGHYTACFLYK